MPKEAMTPNQAAAWVKAEIVHHIQLLRKTAPPGMCMNHLTNIEWFIAGMARRAGLRPGGLGVDVIRPLTKTRPAVKQINLKRRKNS